MTKTNVQLEPLNNAATNAVAGYMIATQVQALEALVSSPERLNLRTAVRNESGATLVKGRLLAVTGFSVGQARPLVAYADKDDPALRPAIGVTSDDVPNNTNFDALVVGTLVGVDTSAFSLTDQLVLGNAGAFSRPPPDVSPFTGEVQLAGSISRVHVTDGQIICAMAQGLIPTTGNTLIALAGTNGTPSTSNRFVTDSDSRMTNTRAPTSHATAHLTGGGDAIATLPTSDMFDALTGVGGAPNSANRFVTNTDSRMSNARVPSAHAASHLTGGTDPISTLPTANMFGALAGVGGSPTASNRFVTDADTRLSDTRTAIAHAATHNLGGADVLAFAPGYVFTFGFTAAVAGTVFCVPGFGILSALEIKVPVPRAGVLRNLRFHALAGPGVGQTDTFLVRLAPAASPAAPSNTTLTVSVNGAGVVTAADTTHSVNVAAGDFISVQGTIAALSVIANGVFSLEWAAA